MGFLKHYLNKYRLDRMSNRHYKNLEKIESTLKHKIIKSVDFEDVLKEFGPQISDLTERASNALENISVRKFHIIINISIEVYQLVELMSESIISDNMTEEDKKKAKIEFSKDLIYFIWKILDPLDKYYVWLPFKKFIEKCVVRWFAGYALETSMNILKATKISVFSYKSTINIFTLP